MKNIHHHLILIIAADLLASCAPVQAGWFSGNDERDTQLAETTRQLESQRSTTDQWELIAGVFGVGCVLLFVIGTALGAKTRHASRA